MITLFICSKALFAKSSAEYGFFSGRVAKVNVDASLVRFKVDFNNQKYLNKKDKIEFWDASHSKNRCIGHLVGRSNEYLLVRIPNFNICSSKVQIAAGTYLHFYSDDLKNNLLLGKDLLRLMTRKRMAIFGKWSRIKKDLDIHIEKVNAVNKRFILLKDKLEVEWGGEIASLEEDRSILFQNFKQYEIKLHEIDAKVEKYRIEEDNLKIDRWALDPKLYYRK